MAGEPIPMPSTKVELLPVTQADRDAVQAFHRIMAQRIMSDIASERPKLGEDEGDAGTLVQAFARHRLAHSSHGVEELREALRASLAKRSVATMDPPYTAAFNAALDMVARDVAPFLVSGEACTLGVGCEQYGVCYAEAHGQPDQCGRAAASPPPVDRAEAGEPVGYQVWISERGWSRVLYPKADAEAAVSNDRNTILLMRPVYAAQPLEGLTSGEGVTLYREIDALGGTGDGEWHRGYTDALTEVLAILSKRGFTEQSDAPGPLRPFLRWARWALTPHLAPTSARTLREVPGMLHDHPDNWSFHQQLSPDEPRLYLGDFRALIAAFGERDAR